MPSKSNTPEVVSNAHTINRRHNPFASAVLVCSAIAFTLVTSTPRALAATGQESPRVAIDRDGKTITPFDSAAFTLNADTQLKPEEATEAAATTTPTLSYPYGIGLDGGGNIYITNLFGGVNVYNVSSLKKTGAITTGLSFPAAVAVNFEGNIYVANNGGNNITIYNPSLTQVGAITDSTLQNPTSMFIDRNDDIWVLDAQGTVHPYLFNGTALPTAHTGGTAIGPWGPNVTVWGIAITGGYQEDVGNIGQALNQGDYFPLYFPTGSPFAGGETQDATGHQYVTDLLHNLVQIWDPTGSFMVGTINTPAAPYGIAVDSVHDHIFVVMTTLNEVYVYSTKAPYALVNIIK